MPLSTLPWHLDSGAVATSLHATAKRHSLTAVIRTVALYVPVFGSCFFLTEEVTPAAPWPVIIVAAIAIPLVIILGLPLERIGDKLFRSLRPIPPPAVFNNVVTEIAIAIGEPVEHILIHDSEVPNLAMLPTRRGEVVAATTGALRTLSRYELQSLVAAQFAGMRDRWCRLATRAEIVQWMFPALVPVGIAFLVQDAPLPGVIWLMFGMGSLFLPRWNEHDRDLCADVVAVQATLDPLSLAAAMRKLADEAGSAHKTDIGAWHLPTSPFLVLPRRTQSKTSVSSGNSRRVWTSAEEIRMELLLRADRAEAMAAGADPQSLTGREFRRRWSQLGRPTD